MPRDDAASWSHWPQYKRVEITRDRISQGPGEEHTSIVLSYAAARRLQKWLNTTVFPTPPKGGPIT